MNIAADFLLSITDTSRKIYRHNNKNITVGEVQSNVFGYAHNLLDKNVKPGDTVVLKADDGINWIYVFWALSVIGAKIIMLLKNLEPHKFQMLLLKHEIQHIITDDNLSIDGIPIININHLVSTTTEKLEPYQYPDHAPMLCCSTSGTNGGFKLAVHSSASLKNAALGLNHCAKMFNIHVDDMLYCPSKLSFGLGWLFSVFGPLVLGYQSIIDEPIAKKLRSFDFFVNNNSINHLILTPQVLKTITQANGSVGSSLKTVITSAESLPQIIADQFKEKFGLSVYNLYGLMESFIVSVEESHHKQNCVGKILPYITARVVNSAGQECLPGERGILQFKTPSQFIEYLDDNKSTVDVIRKGWIHTNDVGYIDQENNLIFLGRYNSCIKIRGKWTHLLHIEDIMLEIPEINDCVVVLSEQSDIEAFVVADNITGHDIQKILVEKLNSRHEVPKNILLVDNIPKTANSKKIRNYSVIKKLTNLDN